MGKVAVGGGAVAAAEGVSVRGGVLVGTAVVGARVAVGGGEFVAVGGSLVWKARRASICGAPRKRVMRSEASASQASGWRRRARVRREREGGILSEPLRP
jgi:hypothetical protein